MSSGETLRKCSSSERRTYNMYSQHGIMQALYLARPPKAHETDAETLCTS